MEYNKYCEITPDIIRLANMCAENGVIDSELFTRYEVKPVSVEKIRDKVYERTRKSHKSKQCEIMEK